MIFAAVFLVIVIATVLLIGCKKAPSRGQVKHYETMKQKWKPILDKEKKLHDKMMNCPKMKNKGECDCEKRIYEYVSFIRKDWVNQRKVEMEQEAMSQQGHASSKPTERTDDYDEYHVAAEREAQESYLRRINEALNIHKRHSKDPQHLKEYCQKYEDNKRIIERALFTPGGKTASGRYKELVPPPSTTGKQD